jgi:hypothetical protein
MTRRCLASSESVETAADAYTKQLSELSAKFGGKLLRRKEPKPVRHRGKGLVAEFGLILVTLSLVTDHQESPGA